MGRSLGTIPPHGEIQHIQKIPVTWFMVADGEEAQIYVQRRILNQIPMGTHTRHPHFDEKYMQELVPVTGMHWRAQSPEDYDINQDTLGRVFESTATTHSSVSQTNIHEMLKLRFMRMVAAELEAAHRQKSFDRLVLIAPPKMLGEVRKQLARKVLATVIAELPKELAKHKAHELATQLEEIV